VKESVASESFYSIANGLQYLKSKGIVHRALSLDSILLWKGEEAG